MSNKSPFVSGLSDSADVIETHSPMGVEATAMSIFEQYGSLIKNEMPLPIETSYWFGLYPARKYFTVSQKNYDHSSSEAKASALAQSAILYSSLVPTYIVSSYYDLLNIEGYEESKCIVVLMGRDDSFLSIVGRWEDDNDPSFEMIDSNLLRGTADDRWSGIASTSSMIVRNVGSFFADVEQGLRFLSDLKYDITFENDRCKYLLTSGEYVSYEQIKTMVDVASNEIDVTEVSFNKHVF